MASADDPIQIRGGRELCVGPGGQITVDSGGTIDLRSGAILRRPAFVRQIGSGAKIGATAGWILGGADDLPYIATLEASKTGSTLVIPIDGLNIGDTFRGFGVEAQIESAGGTVILESNLRAVTNVAAEPTDASFGSVGHIEVDVDTASSGNYFLWEPVVTLGKRYYLLLTGTTAALTDIILLSVTVTIIPADVLDSPYLLG